MFQIVISATSSTHQISQFNKEQQRSIVMSLPQLQTALVVQGPGKLAVEHEVAIPELESDMVLVKTAAVAINPADAKTLDFSAVPGAVHGYDFAGTIVALGNDALAKGKLQIGDRVAGLVCCRAVCRSVV